MSLVITRTIDESVIITTPSGEEIVVIIAKIDGKQIRLAFDTERDVEIVREELVVTEG